MEAITQKIIIENIYELYALLVGIIISFLFLYFKYRKLVNTITKNHSELKRLLTTDIDKKIYETIERHKHEHK